jgi:hypothetical protein
MKWNETSTGKSSSRCWLSDSRVRKGSSMTRGKKEKLKSHIMCNRQSPTLPHHAVLGEIFFHGTVLDSYHLPQDTASVELTSLLNYPGTGHSSTLSFIWPAKEGWIPLLSENPGPPRVVWDSKSRLTSWDTLGEASAFLSCWSRAQLHHSPFLWNVFTSRRSLAHLLECSIIFCTELWGSLSVRVTSVGNFSSSLL